MLSKNCHQVESNISRVDCTEAAWVNVYADLRQLMTHQAPWILFVLPQTANKHCSQQRQGMWLRLAAAPYLRWQSLWLDVEHSRLCGNRKLSVILCHKSWSTYLFTSQSEHWTDDVDFIVMSQVNTLLSAVVNHKAVRRRSAEERVSHVSLTLIQLC